MIHIIPITVALDFFGKENSCQLSQQYFAINLKEIAKNIKESLIEEGKSLSKLPPLIIEDGSEVIVL